MDDKTKDFIIEMMAEKLMDNRADSEWSTHVIELWMRRNAELKEELYKLKKDSKTKRGRPAKKRGPGRPKGSKNKVRK
jgi:hypothetical protein